MNVKYYRTQRGLTQLELAKRSGLSQPHIYAIESGKRQPSVRALIAISQALNVSIAKLVDAEKKAV